MKDDNKKHYQQLGKKIQTEITKQKAEQNAEFEKFAAEHAGKMRPPDYLSEREKKIFNKLPSKLKRD